MVNDNSQIPKHIAIIMDGNRRWARKRGLPSVAGHRKVVEDLLEQLIAHVGELGIPYVTFWAFSTENWNRSQMEIRAIMKLFRWVLDNKVDRLIARGAKLKIIGDQTRFPNDIQQGFADAVDRSKDNDGITVTFALNYGGRDEILRAIARLYKEWIPDRHARGTRLTVEDDSEEILQRSGSSHRSRSAQDDKLALKSLASLSSEELEVLLEANLDTAGMPDPDLVIRTGGEQRLSGFMLWQMEYAELYFPETLMPDFDAACLDIALAEYAGRKRRFGK